MERRCQCAIKKYYKGLCNAVILARSDSSFLLRWYESYKSFRSKGKDQLWSEHSVIIPGQLAKSFSKEIEVLGEEAFFYPSWDEQGLKDLFEEDRLYPNAYVHHLWESAAWKYLSHISPQSVLSQDTTYNKIAGRFLAGI